MRKSKKQLLRTLIACGLVVSVAAGGTVAYLTDAETATNTFYGRQGQDRPGRTWLSGQ